MILSTHFLVSSTFGLKKNLFLIILGGILTHHFLDYLPHWDYSKLLKVNKKLFYQLVFLELVFSFSAILVVSFIKGFEFWEYFFLNLAGVIGILPDGLLFLKLQFQNNKWLTLYKKFHDRFHTSVKLSPQAGMFWQLLMIIFSLIFVLRF